MTGQLLYCDGRIAVAGVIPFDHEEGAAVKSKSETENIRESVKAPQELKVNHKGADEREHLSVLTRREREVYQLLEVAKTNKEIASALGTEERTARFHVANILRKLGKTRRIELLAKDWPQRQ
jgi:LuxR family transcriptional regulator of spore coat protein